MSDSPADSTRTERFPGADCVKVFGAFRIAWQPGKVLVALLGLILTFLWGSALDLVWTWSGKGVQPEAIASYSYAGSDYQEAKGDDGIYEVYSRHLRGRMRALVESVIPAGGIGSTAVSVVASVGGMCKATTWLVKQHYVFALLFFPVLLVIWSCAGGMICRMAAVEFARGETISGREALGFVRRHLWGGFVLAPLIPGVALVLVALVLALGGAFMAIPGLGIVGAVLFILALAAGIVGAVLLVTVTAGGSLFWPVIAVEGTTGFDGFATSFHYVFSRPWRAALYGIVAFVYGAICWLVISLITRLALYVTHACVGWGSSLSERTANGGEVSKLEFLWPYNFGGAALPPHPEWTGGDIVSGWAIAIWVSLLIAVLWAVLVSYYFSASTVVYFLLRRAADLTDCEQIEEMEEYAPDAPSVAAGTAGTPAPAASAAPTPAVERSPAEPAGGDSPPPDTSSE